MREMQGGGGAVCTIVMMIFSMTRSGGEPTTYRARGGHANHLANPERSVIVWDVVPRGRGINIRAYSHRDYKNKKPNNTCIAMNFLVDNKLMWPIG